MEIIVGKLSGFCPGVKRAVTESQNLAKEKNNIYCLGEIVHNKDVVEKLKNEGINFEDELDKIPEGANIIFRAHGVPKKYYEIVKRQNMQLLDLTCPKVLQIHSKIEKYKNDYFIFYTGKSTHPETIGNKGFSNDYFYIIESDEFDVISALKAFKESGKDKAVLISQTTYSVNKFNTISNILKKHLKEKLLIDNTICSATDKRQEETSNLSKQVDCMIVVGGINSSNSRKLYELAKENCKETYFIEKADELDISELKNKELIGIVAGASTPQFLIDDLVNKLEENNTVKI